MSRPLVRWVAVALLCAPAALPAQDTDPLAKLEPQNRFAIETILDSAHAAGIPDHPLLSRAFEGIAKHAPQSRVVGAVRSLYGALKQARTALGSQLNESEWTAAASVIQAGVPVSDLARFRSEKPGKPLARALVVLADLITRGVPIDQASSTMAQMWQHGAAESDFIGLWRNVEEDILSGTNPGTALQQRAHDFPDRSGQQIPSTPTRPPEK